MENYFFDTISKEAKETKDNKLFILIIYDVLDNKRRLKLAKFLQGFGFRIQRSSFEAFLTKQNYRKLLAGIPALVSKEDNVRVYRRRGQGEVVTFGTDEATEGLANEDVVII